MSNDSNEERKIIIDEDWKSQVEREREELKSVGQTASKPAGEATRPEQIPQASFALLVTTLATQVMSALGQIPDPTQNESVVHLGLARHYIDTLAVLEEKTKGNLDQEESAMLEQVLHQLRMLYIEVEKAATATDPQAGS